MMKTNGENMGRIVQRAVESEFQEKGIVGQRCWLLPGGQAWHA